MYLVGESGQFAGEGDHPVVEQPDPFGGAVEQQADPVHEFPAAAAAGHGIQHLVEHGGLPLGGQQHVEEFGGQRAAGAAQDPAELGAERARAVPQQAGDQRVDRGAGGRAVAQPLLEEAGGGLGRGERALLGVLADQAGDPAGQGRGADVGQRQQQRGGGLGVVLAAVRVGGGVLVGGTGDEAGVEGPQHGLGVGGQRRGERPGQCGKAGRGGGQGREVAQRGREMAGTCGRVREQHGVGEGVQAGVVGAGQQLLGRGAQQLAVGGGTGVRQDDGGVGAGGLPELRTVVGGPPADRPAEHGGVLLGEFGEKFCGARVGGPGERLGERVRREGAPGVQQGLGGVGHGGAAGGAAQRAFVAEPAAQRALGGGRVGGQLLGGDGQIAVGAGGVGRQQQTQQGQPVGDGQGEAAPEGGAEAGGGQPVGADALGELVQRPRVRGGVGQAGQHFAEEPPGPPGGGLAAHPGQGVDQALQTAAQGVGAVPPLDGEQGEDHRADAVAGDGLLAGARREQAVQGDVEIEVAALEPLGELLVGEAVAGPGGKEDLAVEHRPGPAALPGEEFLEIAAGQHDRAEAAAGGLVQAGGDAGGEAALVTQPGRAVAAADEAAGDGQRAQVEVGGEDVDPAGGTVGAPALGRPHPAEQAQRERMRGLLGRDAAGCDAERRAGLDGALRREVPQLHMGHQPSSPHLRAGRGAARRAVRPGSGSVVAGGISAAPPLSRLRCRLPAGSRGGRHGGGRGQERGEAVIPEFGPGGEGEAGAGGPQPAHGAGDPRPEPGQQAAGHLLGCVQEHQQRGAGVAGDAGHHVRVDPCRVADRGRTGRGVRPARLAERTGQRVADRAVVGVQVRAGEPEGDGRFRAAQAARRVCGERRGAAGAGRADQGQQGGVAPLEGAQRLGRLPAVGGRGAVRGGGGVHGGGRQLQHSGHVEVDAEAGDGGAVAPQQPVDRPARIGLGCGAQRHGEARGAVRGVQGGAEHGQHRAGLCVQHRAAGGRGVQPQLAAGGLGEVQLDRDGQGVEPVGGGVGGGAGAADGGGQPAAEADPDPQVRGGAVGGADQRLHIEVAGAQQGEVPLRDRGDVPGLDHLGPAAGAAQHHARQAVHGLVAGEHGALVVGEETAAARASGEIADPHQGRH